MYILTKEIRDSFIDGLSPRYAKMLPTKRIKVKTDIEFGAINLYISGTPFLNRGAKKQARMKNAVDIKRTLISFIEKLWLYFNKMPSPKNQTAFNHFHEELCNLFLTLFSANGYTHTYGNAQKFVNVLFKYLACYLDSEEYAEWFKYCHFTLDRYTYNGYRFPFYCDIVCASKTDASAKKFSSWSRLNHEEYTKIISNINDYIPKRAYPLTFNEYLDICSLLSIFLNVKPLSSEDDYVLTPFETEFFIWAIAKCLMKKDSNKKYIYSVAFVKRIINNFSRCH